MSISRSSAPAGTRSRRPVDRLSTTTTESPRARRPSATCEPMKPAPPVTIARMATAPEDNRPPPELRRLRRGLGALVLALHLDRVVGRQYEPAAERALAVLEVHPVGDAALDHLAGLVDRDLAALGRLPDDEAAARLLAALPRRAAVRAAVLPDLAVALRAVGDLLARPGRGVEPGAVFGDQLDLVSLGQDEPRPAGPGLEPVEQVGLALLEQLAGLGRRDRAALLLLPDDEPAARLLAALPRRAAVRAAVLADDAVAVRARPDLGSERSHVLGGELAEILDDRRRELADVAHELIACAGAALDVREPLLPPAREVGRGEGVVAEERDRLPALRRGAELPSQPLDVADPQELLDRLGPGRRRAQAGLLHRLAELLVLDLLAGRLHVLEQRRLGVARRRLRLLLEHLGLLARPRLALVHLGQSLSRLVLVAGGGRLLGGGLLAERRRSPAGLDQAPAAGAEAMAAGLGDDLGVLEPGLGMEDRQEAADDEVEDARVVAGELPSRQLPGRDDRVVVVDLGVVHDPRER